MTTETFRDHLVSGGVQGRLYTDYQREEVYEIMGYHDPNKLTFKVKVYDYSSGATKSEATKELSDLLPLFTSSEETRDKIPQKPKKSNPISHPCDGNLFKNEFSLDFLDYSP